MHPFSAPGSGRCPLEQADCVTDSAWAQPRVLSGMMLPRRTGPPSRALHVQSTLPSNNSTAPSKCIATGFPQCLSPLHSKGSRPFPIGTKPMGGPILANQDGCQYAVGCCQDQGGATGWRANPQGCPPNTGRRRKSYWSSRKLGYKQLPDPSANPTGAKYWSASQLSREEAGSSKQGWRQEDGWDDPGSEQVAGIPAVSLERHVVPAAASMPPFCSALPCCSSLRSCAAGLFGS